MKATLILLLSMSLAGCAVRPPPTDYHAFLQHMPRSIVVLPPLNETAKVNASDAYLATITTSLAEQGYYVFPVVLTADFLKENGLPTPGDMHRVPPGKLREVLGADAVLYVVIKDWSTTYLLIDTTTVVRMDYRLVDTATGTELWHQEQMMSSSASQGSGGGLGTLVFAAAAAVLATTSDPEPGLATQANRMIIRNEGCGMLVGPRHTDFARQQEARRAEDAKRVEVASARR
jgi:hypothetical protein